MGGTRRNRKAVLDALRAAKCVLLASHIYPDIDTVASMLALARALKKDGKRVVCYNATGLPPTFAFLPGAEKIVGEISPKTRFDATVTLDSGSPERFGPLFTDPKARGRLGTLIMVDHHSVGKHFADLEFCDPERASTGEMAAELIEAYPQAYDAEMALCLYAAIVSDTGSFRYSNTQPATFKAAAKFVALGVDPWYVATMLYENRPLGQLKIIGEALRSLKLSADGRVATMSVTREAMRRAGADESMLDGVVNFARSVQGVEVAALLSEDERGEKVKVSFRSKGTVDVGALAGSLGGGGHHNAAGATIEGGIEAAEREVLSVLLGTREGNGIESKENRKGK